MRPGCRCTPLGAGLCGGWLCTKRCAFVLPDTLIVTPRSRVQAHAFYSKETRMIPFCTEYVDLL